MKSTRKTFEKSGDGESGSSRSYSTERPRKPELHTCGKLLNEFERIVLTPEGALARMSARRRIRASSDQVLERSHKWSGNAVRGRGNIVPSAHQSKELPVQRWRWLVSVCWPLKKPGSRQTARFLLRL